MFVCLLPVLMSVCGHVPAGCVLFYQLVLSRWCSLVVLPAVCEWAVGRCKPLFGMFIANNI